MPRCLVAEGTIRPDDCSEGTTVALLKLAGKSRKDDDDDEVVDAGEMGVKVSDEDEQVELVGLGHMLGEFGGGNKSLSACWMGLK